MANQDKFRFRLPYMDNGSCIYEVFCFHFIFIPPPPFEVNLSDNPETNNTTST